MDMLLVAAADIHDNDLVLAKCISTTGPVLSSFDYADSLHPRSTPNSFEVALRVEAELVPSALRVWIRSGFVYDATFTPSANKFIGEQSLTLTAADPSDDRIDVVYVGSSGVAVVEGTPGSGIPSYVGKKALAEITVGAGATEVYQSDIRDVRPRIG